MGCTVRGCRTSPSVHLYVGGLGRGPPHRYTGIAYCMRHATDRIENQRHADHLAAELRAWGA